MKTESRIYTPGADGNTDRELNSGPRSNRTAEKRSATAEHIDGPASKPFPLHCLPPAIADMARAIANTQRTPESLAGSCTLGILSASVGAGLLVESGPQRTTRANIFLVASAESGSGKSETFRHAAGPFHQSEASLLETWCTSELPALQAEKDILESEMAKLRKCAGNADGAIERDEIKAQLKRKKADFAAAEASIHAPRLSCEDVTSEKLAVLLSRRGECMASLSPDAGAVINNLLGRYSKLERTDEGIYLKAFSGDYCRIDRQTREPVVLREPCLAALWLVQPDKVETLLAQKSLTEGGLVPRLLICHTNAHPRHIGEVSASIPMNVSDAYRETIFALLETYRLAEEPRTIQPTPDALQAMNTHYNAIVDRWKSGELRDIGSFALRWTEQAWRIGVCIHAGSHGSRSHERRLELGTAQSAIEVADWFAGQQLEILSVGRETEHRRKCDAVLALLADQPNGVTCRDVQRTRIAPTSGEAHELLRAMEADGELSGDKKATGGRPTRIYTRAR